MLNITTNMTNTFLVIVLLEVGRLLSIVLAIKLFYTLRFILVLKLV
jgi:hypothetical protein